MSRFSPPRPTPRNLPPCAHLLIRGFKLRAIFGRYFHSVATCRPNNWIRWPNPSRWLGLKTRPTPLVDELRLNWSAAMMACGHHRHGASWFNARRFICVRTIGLDTGKHQPHASRPARRVTGFTFYPPFTTARMVRSRNAFRASGGEIGHRETDPTRDNLSGPGVASGRGLYIERIFDDIPTPPPPPPPANGCHFTTYDSLTHDAVRHGAKFGSKGLGPMTSWRVRHRLRVQSTNRARCRRRHCGDQPYIRNSSSVTAVSDTQTMDSPAAAEERDSTGASDIFIRATLGNLRLYADGPDTMCSILHPWAGLRGRTLSSLIWVVSGVGFPPRLGAAPDEPAAIAWPPIYGFFYRLHGRHEYGAARRPPAPACMCLIAILYQRHPTNALPSPALVRRPD